MRGFLGLIGYYRRFITGFATVAAPMTDLLKKGQFVWSNDVELAFNCLKERITTTLILAMPNFNKLFVVEKDVSGYGLGAVLLQDAHPIAFFSQV